MKYLIVTNSRESAEYAGLLISEINRFDVRAQVSVNTSKGRIEKLNETLVFSTKYKPLKKRNLQELDYDLIIVIGDSFDSSLLRKVSLSRTLTCFFLLTKDHKVSPLIYKKALKNFSKVFVDIPVYELQNNSEQIGHYLNDVIKKHNFIESHSERLTIGVLIKEKKNLANIKQLIRSYSDNSNNCTWYLGGCFIDNKQMPNNVRVISNHLDLLKNANVVIVDSEIDSIGALLMNCPQISISGKHRLLGFSKAEKLLINEISGQKIIKSFRPNQFKLIEEELNLLIGDHEYCASMLAVYQNCKNKIGTQPVARSAAQSIIDWLEEN